MRPTAGPSSIRSSGATRGKKIGLTRTGVKTRELAFRDRFVAARSVTRRDGLVKFIESLKRKRLTKRAWIQESAKVGVFAINNTKPLVNRSKQALVGLPGLFEADLLAELKEKDRFLVPMKKAKRMSPRSTKWALTWRNSGARQRLSTG